MADFLGMMKQAAQLQSKMQALQAELDTITVDGTAGGGMVTVTLTAKGDLKGIKAPDWFKATTQRITLESSSQEPVKGFRIGSTSNTRSTADSMAPPKKISADAPNSGIPAKITNPKPIPICPSIDRFRGTRYAALKPSIRLLITLDAAHNESTSAITISDVGLWPRSRNCCITTSSVPGGRISRRNVAMFCCT